jgi:hypothetical protein
MSDPNDPTLAQAAANPAPPEPAALTPDTVQIDTNGEAPAAEGQAAPVEEPTFTDVDPKSLPPKERGAYENMLRDYKRKTADIADLRRKADAYEAWQAEQAAKRSVTDEDYNRAFESKDGFTEFLQKAAEPIVQELNQTKQELRTTKADLFLRDFKSKHTDFDELDSDGLITGYVQLNPPKGEREWEARMKEAYGYAKKVQSKWEDRGYKRGLTRVEQKAEQSTEMPSSSPAQVYSGGDPKKITAKEAVELAMRGIRVPRS